MQKTGNFELNQWDLDDRIQMADFNSDNSRIDAALAELRAAAAAAAAAATAAGNCEMEVITYTGTGTYGSGNATVITFSQKPDIYLIGGDVSLVAGQSDTPNPVFASRSGTSGGFLSQADVSWDGSKLSLTNSVDARYQMNTKGTVYWVLGLRKKR